MKLGRCFVLLAVLPAAPHQRGFAAHAAIPIGVRKADTVADAFIGGLGVRLRIRVQERGPLVRHAVADIAGLLPLQFNEASGGRLAALERA